MKKIGEATILLVAELLSIRVVYWFYRRFTRYLKQSSPFQKRYYVNNVPLNFVYPYQHPPFEKTPGISLYRLNLRAVKNISETLLLNPYSLARA